MKKLKALMIAAFFLIAGSTFAQTAVPVTTPVKKEIKIKRTARRTSVMQKIKN